MLKLQRTRKKTQSLRYYAPSGVLILFNKVININKLTTITPKSSLFNYIHSHSQYSHLHLHLHTTRRQQQIRPLRRLDCSALDNDILHLHH